MLGEIKSPLPHPFSLPAATPFRKTAPKTFWATWAASVGVNARMMCAYAHLLTNLRRLWYPPSVLPG